VFMSVHAAVLTGNIRLACGAPKTRTKLTLLTTITGVVEMKCPKCGSEMDDVITRYICSQCGYDSCFGNGYEEKVKR